MNETEKQQIQNLLAEGVLAFYSPTMPSRANFLVGLGYVTTFSLKGWQASKDGSPPEPLMRVFHRELEQLAKEARQD